MMLQPIGPAARAGGKQSCDGAVRTTRVCAALEPEGLEALDQIARPEAFASKITLFTQDQPAEAVYNLTSGVARLYKLLPDGRRQILGFALPGDFLGLAMTPCHGFSADAIDRVEGCRFARDEFAALVDARPDLLRPLYECFAYELGMAQDHLVLLGRRSAEEKIASFLIHWRDRWVRQNGRVMTVPLPMSRQDIADYLDLTIEAVSRTFSRLSGERTILIVPEGVRMLNVSRIESLAAA